MFETAQFLKYTMIILDNSKTTIKYSKNIPVTLLPIKSDTLLETKLYKLFSFYLKIT